MEIYEYILAGMFIIFIILAFIAVVIKIAIFVYRCYQFLVGRALPPKPQSSCSGCAKGSYYWHPIWLGCSDN